MQLYIYFFETKDKRIRILILALIKIMFVDFSEWLSIPSHSLKFHKRYSLLSLPISREISVNTNIKLTVDHVSIFYASRKELIGRVKVSAVIIWSKQKMKIFQPLKPYLHDTGSPMHRIRSHIGLGFCLPGFV